MQCFNTQPPEGGWLVCKVISYKLLFVSTHSRPKAAGNPCRNVKKHSKVSTHSRPKAAGEWQDSANLSRLLFQHTAARRRLAKRGNLGKMWFMFQHTAARRRLGQLVVLLCRAGYVSTHSRPKAAGTNLARWKPSNYGFNTQPPEGGWHPLNGVSGQVFRFQHTAARRRLAAPIYDGIRSVSSFNTQPPEGGWPYQPLRRRP